MTFLGKNTETAIIYEKGMRLSSLLNLIHYTYSEKHVGVYAYSSTLFYMFLSEEAK